MTSLREALRVWRWPLSAYFGLLIGLFVAAAVSTALYVNLQTERDARRAAQAEARFAAQTAAKELAIQLQLTQATVAQLAANPQIAQTFSQTTPCSLTFGGIAGPDRSHLDVVRADGTVACTSRPETGGEARRYDGAEWMQRALAAPVFVAPARDSATGAWVAVSAAPIAPRQGVVVAFVELTPIAPHLASLYSGPDPAEVLIASSDGATVISRSLDAERSVGTSLAGTPFARAGGAAERTGLDGTSRLYAEAPVAGVGWRLLVGKDKAPALAAGQRLERRQLAIISVGLLAVLLAAWLVHRKLVSPIRRLSDALRTSAGETEPSPVPVSGPAELTALAQDVNALISTVNRELLDRRRAEESARESERNYRLVFESNPNPMWVYDLETLRFLAVNEAALRTYGYERDELLAMTIEDIRPGEDVRQLQALIGPDGPGPERGLTTAGIWRHCRKDGSVFDVDVTSHAHVFEGRPARVVLAVDVTARVEAERALRNSEARYRDLFENASDLIAMVDLESRLTMVNEAFVRALGYTRKELIGRPLRDLVPPEQHERLELARAQKLSDTDATTYEHELVAKDGRRIQVEVATRLIDVEGQPLGVEAICRDITERRQLEEQLRQAQRLEAIGRLAGGIAHDFNNLLTVISGYTDALLEQGDPDSGEELKEIAAAAERATILTRQLLAFSRRQVLQPRNLDLNEVVQGVIPMLTRLIGEDIDLVTSLDPDLDHVVADPNQLEQVVLNLVINARDAMPGGGKLTIATSTTELDESYVADHPEARVGRHATLSVSDNGVGMDGDTVARVFEPFFTTKPVGTGTGLGLSTVYGIVKQSGGNIWVYSEPGSGSAFKVYLPAAQESLAAAAPARPQIAAPTGTETILVVEDEDAVRTLAASMLERSGYTVLATRSAEEALRLAADPETPIDLLLTDLVMPELSGRELAARIVEQLPDIRVLFMSGYADEAVTRHGALDVGTAFLEKPFSARDLARMVRKTLDDASAATRLHVA